MQRPSLLSILRALICPSMRPKRLRLTSASTCSAKHRHASNTNESGFAALLIDKCCPSFR
jgi:hypothetical protein